MQTIMFKPVVIAAPSNRTGALTLEEWKNVGGDLNHLIQSCIVFGRESRADGWFEWHDNSLAQR